MKNVKKTHMGVLSLAPLRQQIETATTVYVWAPALEHYVRCAKVAVDYDLPEVVVRVHRDKDGCVYLDEPTRKMKVSAP